MKMEPIVSSETSAIRTQAPGNYPKRNKLHLEHGESLKTRNKHIATFQDFVMSAVFVSFFKFGICCDFFFAILNKHSISHLSLYS